MKSFTKLDNGAQDNRSQKRRKEYLAVAQRIRVHWLQLFEEFEEKEEFCSPNYWDLMTKVWECDGPVRKTDAMKFMTAVKSAHTAGKYIEAAIKKGILQENANPSDSRSRQLSLSPEFRERLDRFFDVAICEVQKGIELIDRED